MKSVCCIQLLSDDTCGCSGRPADDILPFNGLTATDYITAETKWSTCSSRTKFIVGRCTFQRADVDSFNHSNWVNDAAIHAYLSLLVAERQEAKLGRVYVLPSFLATKWEAAAYSDWLYPKIRFTLYRWILVPINVKNSHWMLPVADCANCTVGIIDSLKGDSTYYLKQWKTYMTIRAAKTGELGEWVTTQYDCARQTDSNSCGVFTLMNAEAIVNGVALKTIKQQDMKSYRKYIRTRLALFSLPYNADTAQICEVPMCRLPTGTTHDWIQCDQCDRWCHQQCAAIAKKTSKNIPFHCVVCQTRYAK